MRQTAKRHFTLVEAVEALTEADYTIVGAKDWDAFMDAIAVVCDRQASLDTRLAASWRLDELVAEYGRAAA